MFSAMRHSSLFMESPRVFCVLLQKMDGSVYGWGQKTPDPVEIYLSLKVSLLSLVFLLVLPVCHFFGGVSNTSSNNSDTAFTWRMEYYKGKNPHVFFTFDATYWRICACEHRYTHFDGWEVNFSVLNYFICCII